ncbi:PP2C family serine/threonine-protein phosphatase [Deinococcus pimensis]|uniref:PP2C family serine/threonine-protein phosphatase n=1 Tax=Deinococcus pimensis TaxID=309888 RepID=UPI0006939087|nr:PP2C family serine/threonine-protein phosphatase [Deinococcus pimensis]
MGTGHHTTGQPCQDAHAVRLIHTGHDEPLLLLVSSDGAGSARHSQLGSTLACEETLRWLEMRLSSGESFLEEQDGVTLVYNLRTLLQNLGEEQGVTLRDLACTLNVAALLPERQWFLQVGDGLTVTQRPGEAPKAVFWPDNGEYANQTYFITDVPDEHVHTLTDAGPIERVALLTDGLQPMALSLRDRAPFTPFFEPMFRAVEALEDNDGEAHARLHAGLAAFLDSPSVNARTSDDKTLILASCRPPPRPEPPTQEETPVTPDDEPLLVTDSEPEPHP